jgi:hypothetical protein
MTPTPLRSTPTLRSLWFGALSGPIVWSLHFLIGYGLTEIACRLGILESQVMGLPVLSIIILLLTLAALLITLFAGVLAYRNWQDLKRASLAPSLATGLQRVDQDSGRFMAFGGLLLNGLFSFLILATGLPTLVLSPCG